MGFNPASTAVSNSGFPQSLYENRCFVVGCLSNHKDLLISCWIFFKRIYFLTRSRLEGCLVKCFVWVKQGLRFKKCLDFPCCFCVWLSVEHNLLGAAWHGLHWKKKQKKKKAIKLCVTEQRAGSGAKVCLVRLLTSQALSSMAVISRSWENMMQICLEKWGGEGLIYARPQTQWIKVTRQTLCLLSKEKSCHGHTEQIEKWY